MAGQFYWAPFVAVSHSAATHLRRSTRGETWASRGPYKPRRR